MLNQHILELNKLKKPQDLLDCSYNFICFYLSKIQEDNKSNHTVLIRKAISYIKQEYKNEKLRLGHVADAIHVNPSYLSILFKKHMNTSFSDYLLQLRMEIATQLLLTSDKRISEIADDIGFSSAQYFSTCFKNYTGHSPKEYRTNKN